MDAEKAFVTLTVLTILNKAQAFLPFSIHCVVQVRQWRGAAVLEEPCRSGAGSARTLSTHHQQRRWGGRGGGNETEQKRRRVRQRRQLENASKHPRIHSLIAPAMPRARSHSVPCLFKAILLCFSPFTVSIHTVPPQWDETESTVPSCTIPVYMVASFVTKDGFGVGSGAGALRWTKFGIIPDSGLMGPVILIRSEEVGGHHQHHPHHDRSGFKETN